MMGASLLAVMIAAKLLVLWGRPVPMEGLAALAFVWQDVAVAIAFFLLFDRIITNRWPARVCYGAIVLLAAIDVPVGRVLFTPLTVPMLRAARGPLGDSIRLYVTGPEISRVLIVLVLGASLALAVRRLQTTRGVRGGHDARSSRWALGCVGAGVALAMTGAVTARHTDTMGLERNVLVALVQTSVPRIRPIARSVDWRESIAPPGTEPLQTLRGKAAGRNVLLVVLESTAARYLAPYGATDDPMPNLSAFAKRALVFENAYAVYPESVKGLVAILASRYPAFDVPAERHAPIASPSLATSLAAAGYETGLFHSGRFMYLGMDRLVAKSGFARIADAGDVGGDRESSFGVDDATTVRAMLGWIDSLPVSRRFFAAYLPIAGHHPYAHASNGPFSERDEVGRYRNALHESDLALGELLAGLRQRHLDASTLVVVISDHGEAFGQHTGNYGHTLALYEENVRVPMMFAIPGIDTVSTAVARVASLLDTSPTVLDLLGLPIPTTFEGESLLTGRARTALFFTDYSLGLLGLRDQCTKVIDELETGRTRAYDVCLDPNEVKDIAPRMGDAVQRYRQVLRDWSAAELAGLEAKAHP